MHMHCIGQTLIVVLSMKMNETINGRVDAVFRATQLDERHVVILRRGQPSRCADRNLANNRLGHDHSYSIYHACSNRTHNTQLNNQAYT